jgi:uncharacterized surface protein with fasciclin (FAS1) repeats
MIQESDGEMKVNRRKKQAAIATVVVLGAIAVGAYAATRGAGELPAKTASPLDGASPTPSALDSTPEVSPEPTVENEEEPVESGSVAPTPSPTSSVSLCPFLPSGSDPGSPQDIADETADAVVKQIPVLSVFASAVQAAGLDATLRTASGLTILAPIDDAFTVDVTEDELDALLLRRHGALRKLLRAHLVPQRHSLATLIDAGSATPLAGNTMRVAAAAGGARIDDDANVVCSDLNASNATLHIIDSVLGRGPAPEEIEAG